MRRPDGSGHSTASCESPPVTTADRRVIEGLHALLDIAPWSTAAQRYDEKVWVETPVEEARDRIIRRHLNEGVEATVEAATRRAEGSDLYVVTWRCD